MCVCASEPTRPRLFNYISILLVTTWVLVVSVVAHSVDESPVAKDEPIEVFITRLIN
jgi:hypothetical protein